MQIEKVAAHELPQLREIAEFTFREAFQAANNPITFQDYCVKAFSIDRIRQEWQQTDSSFFFSKQDGETTGYMKLNANCSARNLGSGIAVQIERLYVLPEFQGKSIGAQLIQFAEQAAAQLGASWLWLSVWKIRPAAICFYERCGFEIFDEEIFWMADEAQWDWLMRKSIPNL